MKRLISVLLTLSIVFSLIPVSAKNNDLILSESFNNAGGAKKASNVIMDIIDKNIRKYSRIT